jgi:hypothetical protein
MYTVSQDDMLNLTPARPNPPPVEIQRADFQSFFHGAYSAACILLSHLDNRLALTPGILAALSPLSKPSATSLQLLMSRPEKPVVDKDRVTLPGYTDIGTVTILFNVAGGL